MLHLLGKLALRLAGWTLVFEEPPYKKYIVIFAPHTSNWDFPIGMAAIFAARLKIRWFAKKSLFVWPLGILMRALGGIRIDRTQTHNTVDYFAASFREHDRFVIGLSPEGSRSRTDHWKSGFYHIAKKAEVPVALAFFDYETKRVGIDTCIELTDSPEDDMETIRSYYEGITGHAPENFGPVRFPTDKSA